MSVDFVNLSMTRRKLIKGAACSAAAASAPSLVNHAFAEQIAKLEKELSDEKLKFDKLNNKTQEIFRKVKDKL